MDNIVTSHKIQLWKVKSNLLEVKGTTYSEISLSSVDVDIFNKLLNSYTSVFTQLLI